MKRGLWLAAFIAGPLWAQVSAREEKITMPTWEIGPAEVHSIFYDAAGRSGQAGVYPYTLKDVLTDRKVDKTYHGVVLENEYIKVLVLPEIGGRLHGALDKTNNYVWLYWQKTIKPGLISMTGAWISGGIEWNFPHGHRPSCFSPVDHRIVRHQDGSATVWVGETEPIYRMRWLVGMTVFPGRSYVRCDYIFINPTNYRNQFQFWATAATHANEWAQAQYPGDMVTGHGKHEFWNWPIHNGVDLTWWKNSPNASSYFAFNNPSDWFGTYDHKAQGGMVHVADHHVMPGKKLWTWGSGPSGRIWEDILTEGGGAYFEPQAGAFSDNQPDNHWIGPHEVKTAHDYWYPVRETRGYHNADKDFAINTDLQGGKAFGAVYSTAAVKGCRVVLKNAKTNAVLSDRVTDISPDKPYTVEVNAGSGTTVYDLHLAVYAPRGGPALELQQKPPQKVQLPEGLKDPGDPRKMNEDQLYRAGEWLDKFVRTGEGLAYYQEALKRDPKDSRVNIEMGFLALKQGAWEQALRRLDTALERDYDNSRIYFGKGIAQAGLRNYAEAYDQFYRAAWTRDYFAPAYLNLARLDLRRGDFRGAIEKLAEAETQNAKFADIQALKAAAYRHAGERNSALAAAERALELDPMHFMGGYEKLLALGRDEGWASVMRDDAQNHLELAAAYGDAGLYRDADDVLARFAQGKEDTSLHPMVNYMRGYFRELSGDAAAAAEFYRQAVKGPVDYTNPHRLEEKDALEAALRRNPSDAHAHLFLGNLLYANERREEAFAHWQKAAELDAKLEHAWRNVAYAQRYLKKDLRASYGAYQKALALDPRDGRVLLEFDQVAEALRIPAAERFALLNGHLDAVRERDDLMARLIDLRLQAGDPKNLELAHAELKGHHFHSWEGRYGIHQAWVEANQALGDRAFARKDFPDALSYYEQACQYPKNLEVAPRTPDFRAHVNWDLAKTYLAMGQREKAAGYLKQILAERYRKAHLGTYYQALAQKALGNDAAYRSLLDELEKRARELTSGKFEYRGAPETIGRYLLALALEEKGGPKAARDPRVARLALREAQIDIAAAHQ